GAAGEHGVGGGAVGVVPVREGADQGAFLHLPRQAGQGFGDLDAGDVRLHRLGLAPHVRGRVRLHVPDVEVAGTAEAGEEDARTRPAETAALRGSGGQG